MARIRRHKAALHMDTVINMTVATAQPESAVETSLRRAFRAFAFVEQICSRFDAQSELSRLSRQVGHPVAVSPLLFEAIRFACEVAADTKGAFDPTIGRRLEAFGFNRHYLTGEAHHSPAVPATYRDVELDEKNRTVLLHKPMVIDLGAVAKGLAADLAAKELVPYEGFVIDAGGDIFAGGLNEQDEPWRIGIQHPLRPGETIAAVRVSNASVCTSGSYERPSPLQAGAHHLIDPRTGASRPDLLSCTVIAPFAMLADAMSTAAFVLGPKAGRAHLEAAELPGLFISPQLDLMTTKEMPTYMEEL